MNPPENRLQHARSPYLLQHAKNPVDWYPWGEEALAKAQKEDKPIFLSIGYSACHWCHVMEHESFEDEQIARILNENFISIKVDREERPDIDQVYQLAFQVLARRAGGWPLSMFLTPDKKPFFGGTYFPPERRHGMPSFPEILGAVLDAYRSRRTQVDDQAKELSGVLQRISSFASEEQGMISPETLSNSAALLLQRADETWGGFGGAPKFPNTMSLDLLLIAAARGDKKARQHTLRTLDRMHRGGIYDHLGGGFARYSTDERWLVPHFEKMLYDNAQLARLYLDGWRLLAGEKEEAPGDISQERCREVVGEIFTYLSREMTAPNGVFYSAQDADSEGVEGKFFAWDPKEIAAVLGIEDAEVVCAYFDVDDQGNFEHGKSVLSTPRPRSEVARRLKKSEEDIAGVLARAKPLLFAAREERIKPMRDDKSLALWNGLMISALAEAGATLSEPDWLEMAKRAHASWRQEAWREGRLLHAQKDGEAYGTGFLDDYAGLALASLDLFEATGEGDTLRFARELTGAMLELFWDEEKNDLYYTPKDGEVVLHRPKDPHDHAYPGGMGLAADALLRLFSLTGEERFRAHAEKLLGTLAGAAEKNPMGLGTVVRAIDRLARGPVEIILMGDRALPETEALLRAARSVYLPHRTLVCVPGAEEGLALGLAPMLLEGRSPLPGGAPRAYVCRGQICEPPVTTPEALREILQGAAG